MLSLCTRYLLHSARLQVGLLIHEMHALSYENDTDEIIGICEQQVEHLSVPMQTLTPGNEPCIAVRGMFNMCVQTMKNELSCAASCYAFRGTLPATLLRARKVNRQDRGRRAAVFVGVCVCPRHAQSKISVISTPGVLHVLGDKERDMVSDQELAKIRDGLARGLPSRPHPHITLGTQIRVRDDFFAGVEGVVMELPRACFINSASA